MSGIKTIPLGCKNDKLKHVQSFRRQVFVLLDNDLHGHVNGPTLIEYEGRNYKVYLSTDEMKCFKCNQKGHIQRNCPKSKSPQETEDNDSINTENQDVNQQNVNNNSTHTNTTAQPVNTETEPMNISQSPANEIIAQASNKEHSSNELKTRNTERNEEYTQNDNNDIATTVNKQVTTPVPEAVRTADMETETVNENETQPDATTTVEERVQTPPSPFPPTPDLNFSIDLPSSVPSFDQSPSLDLSGLTQMPRSVAVEEDEEISTSQYNISYPPLQSTPTVSTQDCSTNDSDVDDNDSVISDISEITLLNSKISLTAIREFLQETKHSKKFIQQCIDFNPNLKELTTELLNYRTTQPLNVSAKARILKLVKKIRKHVRTV